MAHTCPECGAACYCGGDIDDVFIEETAINCTHCDLEESEYDEYEDYS